MQAALKSAAPQPRSGASDAATVGVPNRCAAAPSASASPAEPSNGGSTFLQAVLAALNSAPPNTPPAAPSPALSAGGPPPENQTQKCPSLSWLAGSGVVAGATASIGSPAMGLRSPPNAANARAGDHADLPNRKSEPCQSDAGSVSLSNPDLIGVLFAASREWANPNFSAAKLVAPEHREIPPAQARPPNAPGSDLKIVNDDSSASAAAAPAKSPEAGRQEADLGTDKIEKPIPWRPAVAAEKIEPAPNAETAPGAPELPPAKHELLGTDKLNLASAASAERCAAGAAANSADESAAEIGAVPIAAAEAAQGERQIFPEPGAPQAKSPTLASSGQRLASAEPDAPRLFSAGGSLEKLAILGGKAGPLADSSAGPFAAGFGSVGDGTTVAPVATAMKAMDLIESAEKIVSAEKPAASAASGIASHFSVIADSDFSSASQALAGGLISEASRASTAGVAAPNSAAPNPAMRLANCEALISHQVGQLRLFGADSLSVVLKPDARTELYLNLSARDGGVEASVRLDRGDLHFFKAHWGELQQSLAQQNVRLAPLREALAPFASETRRGGHSDFSQTPEDRRGRASTPEEEVNWIGSNTDPIRRRSARGAQRAARATGWETWA